MYITELNSKNNLKNVTVNLSYEDIRDISNGLYLAQTHDKEYNKTYVQCKVLLDLVKHGNVQSETVARLNELQETSSDKSSDKGGNKDE